MKRKVDVEEESKKENSAPPVEIVDDIPDEIKPFVCSACLLCFEIFGILSC